MCYDYLGKLGVEVIGLDPANPDAFNAGIDRHLNERTKVIFVDKASNMGSSSDLKEEIMQALEGHNFKKDEEYFVIDVVNIRSVGSAP